MSRVQRIVIRDDREITRVAIRDDREITRVVNVGPKGPKGDDGAPGTGLRVDGVLSSTSQLPGGAAAGDAYLVSGDLWVWSGTAWVNAGPVQGPKGDPGSDFILLGDTPSSYAGRAGDLPVVNEAEDALEFRELGAAAKTLQVKTAAQLSGADYLLGHDAGSPAGMRTLLSSLTEFMIGDIQTSGDGQYIRAENGIYAAWHSKAYAYPADHDGTAFQFVWSPPGSPIGTPFIIATARRITGQDSVGFQTLIGYGSSGRIFVDPGGHIQNLDLLMFAFGRWK